MESELNWPAKGPEECKALQKVIDERRAEGAQIVVNECCGETNVSIKFSDEYDAFEVADDIRSALGHPCDSGAGMGWRDLQLCAYYPGLK